MFSSCYRINKSQSFTNWNKVSEVGLDCSYLAKYERVEYEGIDGSVSSRFLLLARMVQLRLSQIDLLWRSFEACYPYMFKPFFLTKWYTNTLRIQEKKLSKTCNRSIIQCSLLLTPRNLRISSALISFHFSLWDVVTPVFPKKTECITYVCQNHKSHIW
jgi:hypothetical protein